MKTMLKITKRTVMKTVQNIVVAVLAVCVLGFLFFGGRSEQNGVVAQNQENTQQTSVTIDEQLSQVVPVPQAMPQPVSVMIDEQLSQVVPVPQAMPQSPWQTIFAQMIKSPPMSPPRGYNVVAQNQEEEEKRNIPPQPVTPIPVTPDLRNGATVFLNGQAVTPKPVTPDPWNRTDQNRFPQAVTPKPVTLDQEPPKPLTQEQLEAIAIQPATKYEETGSRVVPAMLPLFQEEFITYTGKDKYKDTVLKYRLHVPKALEQGKKYPLILWLHGGGERGDDNKLQLVHLHHIITYLTGEKKRDFFLLVPQTPQEHSGWDAYSYNREELPESLAKLLKDPQTREKTLKEYESAFGSDTKADVSVTEVDGKTMLTISEPFEDSPLGFSFAMLDQVIRNYPVDTDRITVSGLSTGGDGTWRALERRPELFAAAVPLVSWIALTDEALRKNPVLKKIPIWAIYSSDDNGIDSARADFERVEKAGCNVKKSEFGICGHNAWTPAMLQADIFSWLLSRAKKDGDYIAVVDANVNPDDLKGIVDVATRDTGKPKLAPAPPQSVSQTATETAKTDLKPAASFSVPQQQLQNVVVTRRDSSGNTVTVTEQRLVSVPQSSQPVRQTAKETAKTELKPVGTVIIQEEEEEIIPHPQPTQNVVVQRRDSAGNIVGEIRTVATQPVPSNAKDELYFGLAIQYFLSIRIEPEVAVDDFSRNFVKLSPIAQKNLAAELLNHTWPAEKLQILEKMIDQIPLPQTVHTIPVDPFQVVTPQSAMIPQNVSSPYYINQRVEYIPNKKSVEPPEFTAQRGDEEVTVTGKVIEDCDRPWAMTSDSLYGMFPADWNKEAQKIPEFIVELDSAQLAKKLAASISGDGKDFNAACQSILTLENKPMSSPWFETDGGRLRSDIRYSLSAKGQMFVRLLRTVKDLNGNDEKKNLAKLAQKTLEKIELILEVVN